MGVGGSNTFHCLVQCVESHFMFYQVTIMYRVQNPGPPSVSNCIPNLHTYIAQSLKLSAGCKVNRWAYLKVIQLIRNKSEFAALSVTRVKHLKMWTILRRAVVTVNCNLVRTVSEADYVLICVKFRDSAYQAAVHQYNCSKCPHFKHLTFLHHVNRV